MNWGLFWLFSPPLQNKCIGKMSSNSTPTGLNLKLGKLLEQQTQLYRRSWIISVRDPGCCNIKSGEKLNQIISLFQSLTKFRKKIEFLWNKISMQMNRLSVKEEILLITGFSAKVLSYQDHITWTTQHEVFTFLVVGSSQKGCLHLYLVFLNPLWL